MTTRIIGIQARMGSTRLPGKVLMDLGGKTMLERVIDVAQQDCMRVYVLTTTNPEDAEVEECAFLAGARCLRGSPDDVLSRYIGLLDVFPDDDVTLLRLCADAPFIQPGWCRAAFHLAETTGKPVWIESFCHVGTAAQWRECSRSVGRSTGVFAADVEHAGNTWFWQTGVQVESFVPDDYLMVNTREDYEEAQRRFARLEKATT